MPKQPAPLSAQELQTFEARNSQPGQQGEAMLELAAIRVPAPEGAVHFGLCRTRGGGHSGGGIGWMQRAVRPGPADLPLVLQQAQPKAACKNPIASGQKPRRKPGDQTRSGRRNTWVFRTLIFNDVEPLDVCVNQSARLILFVCIVKARARKTQIDNGN